MSDVTKQIAARIVAGVAHLPEQEQINAILQVCSSLSFMASDDDLRRLRADIGTLGDAHCVHQAIDMIDGQLALRQIQREDAK